MDYSLKHLIERLSQSEVFKYSSDQELLELANLAMRKSLKKGDILCRQGENRRFVMYIGSGALRSVINNPNGKEYIVSTWEAGDEFWSHTLLDQEPMPSTLEAIKSSTIFWWNGDAVLELILGNNLATRALLRRQTQLIRDRRENIYNLAFNPVANRLAKLILEKFIKAENSTVQRDLSLEDMASMIASSPEVICRIMYQFQADGLLSIDRASITLHDYEALEKFLS